MTRSYCPALLRSLDGGRIVRWHTFPPKSRPFSILETVQDDGDRRTTWRPLLFGRICFAVLGVGLLGAAAALGVYAVMADTAQVALAAILLAWAIPFLLALRSRITLGEDALEYRNFGTVRRIPWGEIQRVSAGYYGITLTVAGLTSNRTRVTAMAVQKSNAAQAFRWGTRADELVKLIERRASICDDPDNGLHQRQVPRAESR